LTGYQLGVKVVKSKQRKEMLMAYQFEPLDTVVRSWIEDRMGIPVTDAEWSEFEREYNQYLDEQDKDFDEDAYIKYMESEGAFATLVEDPDRA
jgi:hypothetical protein